MTSFNDPKEEEDEDLLSYVFNSSLCLYILLKTKQKMKIEQNNFDTFSVVCISSWRVLHKSVSQLQQTYDIDTNPLPLPHLRTAVIGFLGPRLQVIFKASACGRFSFSLSFRAVFLLFLIYEKGWTNHPAIYLFEFLYRVLIIFMWTHFFVRQLNHTDGLYQSTVESTL